MLSNESGKKDNERRSITIGAGVAIGAGIGAAIGAALDNMAIGLPIGIAIGIAIGAAVSSRHKGSEDSDPSKDSDGNPDE